MTENSKKFPIEQSDNDRLLQQIFPQTYQNPTGRGKYNLVVIGAGTAGLVTAAAAAKMGAKVALIEKQHMGGDCLNLGCVPSKAIISDAKKMHASQTISSNISWDEKQAYFQKSMARMRKLRADFAKVDSVERFDSIGVDVYLGQAQFTSPNAIEVEGQTLSFAHAVIATGGKPRALKVDGLDESQYHTNETIFAMQTLPKRLVVVGAGPIGCEMAQTFARFGSQVTVVNFDSNILIHDDPSMAKVVYDQCVKDGVTFQLKTSIEKVEHTADGKVLHLSNGQTVTCDEILVSIGREPNMEGLGLENACIEKDKHGITVNDKLQTTNKKVFAIGDVATPYKFTHVADEMARVVIQNTLFPVSRKMKDVLIPWVTYTDPELAFVFPQYGDLKPEDCEKIEMDMEHNDRSLLEGRNEGKMLVYLHPDKGHIMGGHIVGPHAGELIGQLTIAASQKLQPKAFASLIYAYPTRSSIFRGMGDEVRKNDFKPLYKKIFNKIWAWQRGQS
jgi:pyruvate/2-oxoglutarate dehydrogenase complex dihydrolipoamide dehydrogenase (E3) component